VVSYLGTTDPDGWVLCDGQPRTSTDNRYINIYVLLNTALNVTTNTSNYIIPPDLRARFILGNSAVGTSTISTGGNSSVTLTTANLPSHSHTISDPGHFHNIATGATHSVGLSEGDSQVWGQWSTQLNLVSGNGGGTNTNRGIVTASTGITGTANTGSGNSFSILPVYSAMNYIIKY